MRNNSASAAKNFGASWVVRCVVAVVIASIAPAAFSRTPADAATQRQTEVAFGPEGGAEALILKFIANAKSTIRVAAFAFSSPVIVDALVAAQQRGVDVKLVVDHKHNVETDPRGIGRAALAAMVKAGAIARTNANYRVHHDKFIIADSRHVQTGSYNYAVSANRNSENVLVVWDDPELAEEYLAHWASRFNEGR